ncbi:hypothetical protein [Streptomyces sp. Ac-502]|uniref:hypothetical protein n=1 Tax=Streptomyces sp. Ac-502 TaxID=3342801 RepID=UPI0038624D6F
MHGWTEIRLSMRELLALALERACYVREPGGQVHGLIYRPFMAWIGAQFGFTCQLIENTPVHASAPAVRPGQALIASVSWEIRDPATHAPRRGGHLVLIHAAHAGTMRFHNPSGYSHNAASATLSLGVFARFHAGRGILVSARA